MPENPFPINISEKEDSFEKDRLLANVDARFKYTAEEFNLIIRALNFLYSAAGDGSGDMLRAIYDPNNRNGDVFSMGNMRETEMAKVFTAAERASLENIVSYYNNKVDKEAGKGLSDENYTLGEKQKLAGLEGSKWLGLYPTLTALQNAHPTAEAGNYADVDAGTDVDTIRYVWDVSDNVFIRSGSGTPLTPAQIKLMYESNLDTNAYTDAEKIKLAGLENGVQLGETDTTAYRGDLGKDIYTKVFEVPQGSILGRGAEGVGQVKNVVIGRGLNLSEFGSLKSNMLFNNLLPGGNIFIEKTESEDLIINTLFDNVDRFYYDGVNNVFQLNVIAEYVTDIFINNNSYPDQILKVATKNVTIPKNILSIGDLIIIKYRSKTESTTTQSLKYYVRPIGQSYGNGSGTSYINAWSGFSNIDWDAVKNNELVVSGMHAETLEVGANCIIEMGDDIENGEIDATNLEFGIKVDGYNIIGRNLNANNADTDASYVNSASNIYFENTISKIYNATANNSINQGFQHWNNANVTYYGTITSSNNGDEGMSSHGNCYVVISDDCTFISENNYQAGINFTNTSEIVINGVLEFNNNGTGAAMFGDILMTGDSTLTINSAVDLNKPVRLTETATGNLNNGIYSEIIQSRDSTFNIYNSVIKKANNITGTLKVKSSRMNVAGLASSALIFLMFEDSYIIIDNSIIMSTSARDYSVIFKRCLILNGMNTGNMIENNYKHLEVSNCVIKGVPSGKWGIIIRENSLSNTINNVVIDGLNIGGGISTFNINLTMNDIIIFNTLRSLGVVGAGNVLTANNFILFNSGSENASSGTVNFVNRINSDPLFLDPENDNYGLNSGSDAIGNGVILSENKGILEADWGTDNNPPVIIVSNTKRNDIGAYTFN